VAGAQNYQIQVSVAKKYLFVQKQENFFNSLLFGSKRYFLHPQTSGQGENTSRAKIFS